MAIEIVGAQFRCTHTIGGQADFGPGFRCPVAAASGEGDLIYVVNRGEDTRPEGKRITICTEAEDYVGEFAQGVTMAGVVEASSADGSLLWPTSIALDKHRNVYVADEWLNRISMFNKDGDWIGKWGTSGEGDGRSTIPRAWLSMETITFCLWTAGTTASRSSPKMVCS